MSVITKRQITTAQMPEASETRILGVCPASIKMFHEIAAGRQADGYYRRPGTLDYNIVRLKVTDYDRRMSPFLEPATEVWLVYD